MGSNRRYITKQKAKNKHTRKPVSNSDSSKMIRFLTVYLFVTIVVVIGFGKYIANKTIDEKPKVVAPYYEAKDFLKPKEIIQKKAISAYKIPIIMYHYVEYVKDINDFIRKRLDITPDNFEGHLRALHNANYKTYFVKDIPDIVEGLAVVSNKSVILTFDDGYEDFYTDVYPLLKKYRMKATVYVIVDFINRKGFLTDSQIKELANSGLVEIGSHTLDHLYLKTTSNKEAERQIMESKQKFKEQLGIETETFAYPYGAFSTDTIEIVKKAGYKAAVSVIPGTMQSEDNLFYMSRIRPGMFTPYTIIGVLENFKK